VEFCSAWGCTLCLGPQAHLQLSPLNFAPFFSPPSGVHVHPVHGYDVYDGLHIRTALAEVCCLGVLLLLVRRVMSCDVWRLTRDVCHVTCVMRCQQLIVQSVSVSWMTVSYQREALFTLIVRASVLPRHDHDVTVYLTSPTSSQLHSHHHHHCYTTSTHSLAPRVFVQVRQSYALTLAALEWDL